MAAAFGFFGGRGAGALVVPGKYTVTMAKRINGVVTPFAGSQTFEVAADGPSSAADRAALAEFSDKLARLQKTLTAAEDSATEARTRLDAIRRAVDATPSLPPKLYEQTLALERNLDEINTALVGDRVMVHNPGGPLEVLLGPGPADPARLAGPVRKVADVTVPYPVTA